MATGAQACFVGKEKMNALIINCSPVKNGATAEIVKIANDCIKHKYDTTTVCIDDYKFNFVKAAEPVIQQQNVFNMMILIL